MGYIIAVLGGIVAGIIFFGGLYWTVKKLPDSRSPALVSVTSLVIRTAVTMIIFYLVMDGNWQYALVSLAGFLGIRIIVSFNNIKGRDGGMKT